MKTTLALGVVAILAIATYAASSLHHRLQPEDDAKHLADAAMGSADATETEAPVHVTVGHAQHGSLTNSIVALGTVVVAQDSLQTVTAPTELRLLRVLVTTGDPVHAGTAIAEAELTQESLAIRQAALSDRDQARLALDSARERFNRQLATRQEVEQATQALSAAEPKASMWTSLGASSPMIIAATADGTVLQVVAHRGQVLASGGAVCECAGPGIEARIGFDAQYAHDIHVQQLVHISFPGPQATGTLRCPIRSIASALDPESHLLDALVTLPNGAAATGTLVRGEVSSPSPVGWLVPRQAVDPSDDGDVLYSVAAGVAHQHHVTILASNQETVAISAADLADGDLIVYQGNVELHDGSTVIVDH